MTTAGSILIVEDDPMLARAIARLVSDQRPAVLARTMRSARALFGTGDQIDAVVVDIVLPDGNGLDLAAEIRGVHEDLPMLILTAHVEKTFINRAQTMGLEFACKPDYAPGLAAFLERALVQRDERAMRVAVRTFAAQHALSDREAEILERAVAKRSRADLAGDLGVSENTLKTEIRALLTKCDAPSLSELARSLRASVPR